jgi:hypothetical protein
MTVGVIAQETVMSNPRTAATLVGALAIVPATGLALPTADVSQPTAAVSAAASSKQTMHATKGVVKSIDATNLVIRRSGRDMSFALNPSTQREGNVKVGSPVEVRYRTEANHRVATVVAAEQPKATASLRPISTCGVRGGPRGRTAKPALATWGR